MCTAISLLTSSHYFGRNLDLHYSYHETITITPRNYPLPFRYTGTIFSHPALIGMAYVCDDYPLYYEAANEHGLCMAGLNFPENAYYRKKASGKINIAPFELIPWVLSQCSTVKEAEKLLSHTNLIREPYNDKLPLTPLHFMISDSTESLVVEPMKEGLKLYSNPVGVLTNNPPFPLQLFSLNNYMGLSNLPPENYFSAVLPLDLYSNGMGALGLPGDWSSQSRFVRASFAKMNSSCGLSEEENVSQFFHLLDCVEHPRGVVCTMDNKYEITVYSCCLNAAKGIYYYKTYENSRISAVHMHRENLDSTDLICYLPVKGPQFLIQNE